MSKLEFWWDVFLLALYPLPAILFYWLFGTEYPIQKVSKDGFILVSYVIVGIGTLVYIVHWCGLIKRYPKSRYEAWPSWYGAIRPLSVSGIWVCFIFCHSSGIFIALWSIVSELKRLVSKIR